jgi:hypothetical protein
VELVEVEAAGAVRTIVSFLLRKAKNALDRPEVQFGRGGGLLGLENGCDRATVDRRGGARGGGGGERAQVAAERADYDTVALESPQGLGLRVI